MIYLYTFRRVIEREKDVIENKSSTYITDNLRLLTGINMIIFHDGRVSR